MPERRTGRPPTWRAESAWRGSTCNHRGIQVPSEAVRPAAAVLLIFLGMAATALQGCGGSNSCAGACDHIKSCALKSSGLSCNENCSSDAERKCADCLNAADCNKLASNGCSSECPGVTLTK